LDEPAAGLDEIDHHDLCLRLRRIAATGVAIVIVEHNLPFLLGIADRVACLDGGRLIGQGPPAAIRTDARVIGAYFGDPGAVP
jgi:branched-chain amino acid transport system permease protein